MSERTRTAARVVGAPAVLCRSCGAGSGDVVLDLGHQPASDYFPPAAELGDDPRHPLQMWLCSSCGLAQLLADPTVPEEPLAAEPVALVEQAATAVDRLASTGWLRRGQRVIEFGSPHGGSWLPMLAERGISEVASGEQADVVLDCFGLMHEADQHTALRHRAARVAPGGTLLLQFHSVATIVRLEQWNSLRHGHYAYYSTITLARMLTAVGLQAVSAWTFDLYGGTVLLAARRAVDTPWPTDRSVTTLLNDEAAAGITTHEAFANLDRAPRRDAQSLRNWLEAQKDQGMRVAGYGAASRAVALLCMANINQALLSGIGDASPAKQGRRMPGTDIPVISPAALVATKPDVVLLMLPDLLDEVRRKLAEVESSGGHWVTMDDVRGPWSS